MQTRVTILGHTQRGGNPTVHDRLMAFEFSTLAVGRLFTEKSTNEVVVFKESKFEFVCVEDVNEGEYEIDLELLKLLNY